MEQKEKIVEGNRWISVSERLPENHRTVLVFNGKKDVRAAFYTKGHEVTFDDEDYDGEYDPIEERDGVLYLKPGWYEEEETPGGSYDWTFVSRVVTHWMPLPEPPIKPVNS